MDVPDALAVERDVFMVFTWHCMNTFDLGTGDEVCVW